MPKISTLQNEPPILSGIKTPPHSIEAETAVLGGLLKNNDAWIEVGDILSEKDFYRREHQLIFHTIVRLSVQNQPFDGITLSEELQTQDKLKEIGGHAYVAELIDGTAGATNIIAYAQIIKERSILRNLLKATNKISDQTLNPEGYTAQEILDMAEQSIFDIQTKELDQTDGPQAVSPLLVRTIDQIKAVAQNPNILNGLPTGFDELDDLTSGFRPSDLVIVAGRPAMGKTSFALNLVENALFGSMDEPGAVALFSMEMPSEQLLTRILSSLARVDQTRIRNASTLSEEDWTRLTSATSLLNKCPLFIDETPALSPVELRNRCRRIARTSDGMKLIVVDYLQLMKAPGAESRVNEISEISRSLKALAKELKCPVISLSQLNRTLEQRVNKRPVMSDLRESGAIEQDADTILFIYRDEVYNPETVDKGIAEIIIGKQRNGPIGVARLAFISNLTKFDNLAPERHDF